MLNLKMATPVSEQRNPSVVLVTGGLGFIGSNLLVDLLRRYPDRTFVNLDVQTYAANPLSLHTDGFMPGENYRSEKIDLRNVEAVREVVRRWEPGLVIHLAAESHVDRSILGPRAFLETNVTGTLNLLEACRELWTGDRNGHFHHVSTDEVYGSLGPEGKFTETTPYSPRSPYSASKASSDHLVRAYHETYGMSVSITNCSNNYGPRQHPEKLIPLMIFNAIEGKPLPVYGDGLNVRDWLYVDDHVEAIWRVATEGRSGETYNVGGDSERTNLDLLAALLDAVADQTGKDRAELEALKTFVKDRPGHDRRYAIDASKIEADLGWRPRHTLETGLHATVAWYLANPHWIQAARERGYDDWVGVQYAGRSQA